MRERRTLAILVALAGCSGQLGESFGPGEDAVLSGPERVDASTAPEPPVKGSSAKLCASDVVHPGRAPLRRLTRFEYNNTVRDLLGDATNPASSLPSEEVGNGFGNDADALAVSSLLAEQYGSVAAGIAQRASLPPCAVNIKPAAEAACLRTFAQAFGEKAYRRPLASAEVDELVALAVEVRKLSSFPDSLNAIVEAVLQSPDFLYRPELGVADAAYPELRRPTGYEMATRLSYLFWGTMPDDALRSAAPGLMNKEAVLQQAQRLLADPRARSVVRFFFDNLLPISNLTDLERNKEQFPTFNAQIGGLMHREVQALIEHEVFEANGTWASLLTAPYTFVNHTLANFYGMPGVVGEELRKVPLDPTQRLGLLTLGGVMAGSTHSNSTNPVTRGSFVVQKLMCQTIPLPMGDILEKVKPPDPYSGKTARERFSAHRQDPVCQGCHANMDPIGLTLENYDPVGLFRRTENDVTIDASGKLPGSARELDGPIAMVRELAANDRAQACFATHWLEFAYGLSTTKDDECARRQVVDSFAGSGNIRQLLLDLTQTDAFHYLPKLESL